MFHSRNSMNNHLSFGQDVTKKIPQRVEAQRQGRRQVDGYLLQTQGPFDEGYVAGPFLDPSKGTITLSTDGDLVFDRAEQAVRPISMPGHLVANREKQLKAIGDQVRYQVAKNRSLSDTLGVCGAKYRVGSYLNLVSAMSVIDFDLLCC